MSADMTSKNSARPSRIRRPWFLLWWVLATIAVVSVFQLPRFSPDHQNVSKIVGVLAIFIGFSIWFLLSGIGSKSFRRVSVAALWIVLFVLHQFVVDLRIDGAAGIVGMRWAWEPHVDELLDVPQSGATITDWQTTSFDYPRFLGNGYWAEVKGVEIDADWKRNPPQEIWRQPIGAGWSAFAVVGNYAVTQEQRGPAELVTCYRVSTGEPVWIHQDEARFDPQDLGGNLGGIGPRATPTIHDARVYTQGATGIVNCLDARTGDVLWSHDLEKEFGVPTLMWGKSGSPLVIPDLGVVVINVGVPPEKSEQEDCTGSLTAFDLETGEVRWQGGNRTTAYASPVECELAGERQILQVNEGYLTAHRAADGKMLWQHEWPSSSSGSAACAQPVPLEGDRIFLTKGYGLGSTLLYVTLNERGEFEAMPLWKPEIQPVLKTKLCNIVIRDGYAYGLDDTLLQCVDIESGNSKWKKRRSPKFGHGQVLLVGDHLLVTTERGELLLVECSPENYNELASIRVLDESGITWNNPALSGPYLLVRNDREAACYRLPVRSRDVAVGSVGGDPVAQ